jgi:hypothetical protein
MPVADPTTEVDREDIERQITDRNTSYILS